MTFRNALVKTGDSWTQQQIEFAEEYVRSGSRRKACEVSGYSEAGGRSLINSVDGMRLLRSIFVKIFTVELAPKALRVLRSYADADPALQKLSKTQLEAAKTILDRAGFIAPKASAPSASESTLAGKSMDELNQIIDAGKRAIARLDAQDAQFEEVEANDFMG